MTTFVSYWRWPRPFYNKRTIVGVGAVALVVPAYFFLTLPNPAVRGTISAVLLFIYTGITAFLFYWSTNRTKQQQPRLYPSWRLLTFASYLLAVATGLWLLLRSLFPAEANPAIGLVFTLVSNLLFAWGIMRIPQIKQTKLQLARQLIDSITVFIGSALLPWLLWVGPHIAHFSPILRPLSYQFSTRLATVWRLPSLSS